MIDIYIYCDVQCAHTARRAVIHVRCHVVCDAERNASLLLLNGMYHGEYDDSTYQAHGRGWIAHDHGDQYDGEWHQGRRHGHGDATYVVKDEHDAPRGKGRKRGHLSEFKHCDTYSGQHSDGYRHGLGVFRHAADGSMYAGEWQRDRKHGLGVVWNADGVRIQCGRFEDGLFKRSCGVPLCKIPQPSAAYDMLTSDGLLMHTDVYCICCIQYDLTHCCSLFVCMYVYAYCNRTCICSIIVGCILQR